MLHIQLFSNVKIIAIILLAVLMLGCGGGRTNTASNAPVTDEVPAPVPAPAPGGTTGSATLNWLPPTTYTDESVIAELGGHNIYIDDGSGYTKLASINNPSVTTYIVEGLSPGTYSFVVTAFDSSGTESAFSKAASISISS